MTLLSNLALSRADVAFTLRLDNRRALETPGDGDLISATAAVHGCWIVWIISSPSCRMKTASTCRSAAAGARSDAADPRRLTLLVNGQVQSRALGYADVVHDAEKWDGIPSRC